MFTSITCDFDAAHINFKNLGNISFICTDTQNQLIFYFLGSYHPGKIKVEDHNNTRNAKQRSWWVMQANEVNQLYDVI